MSSRSATRVGAWRYGVVGAGGQLGGRERAAVEEVVLAGLDEVESVSTQDRPQDRRSRDDHGRPFRLEPGQRPTPVERDRRQTVEQLLDRRSREDMAVDTLRVVVDE